MQKLYVAGAVSCRKFFFNGSHAPKLSLCRILYTCTAAIQVNLAALHPDHIFGRLWLSVFCSNSWEGISHTRNPVTWISLLVFHCCRNLTVFVMESVYKIHACIFLIFKCCWHFRLFLCTKCSHATQDLGGQKIECLQCCQLTTVAVSLTFILLAWLLIFYFQIFWKTWVLC